MSAKNLLLIKSGLAVLLVPIFFSCDDPSQLGIELDNDDSKIDVEFVDITIPSSIISIDSFATYHFRRPLNEVMFGNLTDSIYGQVTATPFVEFRMIGSNVFSLPEDTLTFSKAYISLRIDEIYAERFLMNEEISIYNAQDTLNSNLVYLSSTDLNYDNSTLIGYRQFTFNPALDTMINIPLDQDFGVGLFEKLKNASVNDDYKDSLFLGYDYPALVFEPGANNEGLYVFNLNDEDDTTAVYVEMTGQLGATYHYKFYFTGQPRYTKIDRNRAPGKLSDLLTEYQESQVPSPRVYLNPMSGVYPKLDLQALIDFADTSENIIVNKAEIRLKTVTTSNPYEEILNPIQFYLIGENGRINGPGAISPSFAVRQKTAILDSRGDAQAVFHSSEGGYFSGDITEYAQYFLNAKKSEIDYPPHEIVIFSNSNSNYPVSTISPYRAAFIRSEIKLRLFYTRLK